MCMCTVTECPHMWDGYWSAAQELQVLRFISICTSMENAEILESRRLGECLNT